MTSNEFDKRIVQAYPGIQYLLNGMEYYIIVGPDLGGLHKLTHITNVEDLNSLIHQLKLFIADLERRIRLNESRIEENRPLH